MRRGDDDRHPDSGAGARTHARADHDHEQADHDDEHDVDQHLDDHVDEGGQRREWQWGHRQRLSGLGAPETTTKPAMTGRDAEYTREP